MYSQCPSCYTIFKIQAVDLEAASGKVRCGECGHIYNARDNLAEELPASLADQTESPGTLQDTDTEPEPAPEPEQQPKHLADEIDLPSPAAVYFPKGKTAPRYRRGATAAWSLGILAAMALLAVQYGYYNRAELAHYTELRPWLEKMCQAIDCQIPLRRDPAQIAIANRRVIEHPRHQNALLVRATIVNKASFTQPFPILQLSLSDIEGNVLARGRFTPQQYLLDGGGSQPMAPQLPVKIKLEVVDPDEKAVNFEFAFL